MLDPLLIIPINSIPRVNLSDVYQANYRLEFIYCIQKKNEQMSISWSILMNYNLRIAMVKFNRESIVQWKYENHMKSDQHIDFIHSMLHRLSRVDYVITTNKFPYHLDPGIEHKILWVSKNYNNTITELYTTLKDKYLKRGKSIILTHNDRSLMSVPTIDHWHLFIKSMEVENTLKITGFVRSRNL